MSNKLTAALATLGIAAAAFALPPTLRRGGFSRERDRDFYRAEQTPRWAPPAWAFPVAWGVSTLALAAATQHLLRHAEHPRRHELLTYLGVHGALFVTFERAYFGERSPVLAAAWTTADFAVCHLAFYRAFGVDRGLALGWVPVNLWLTLALPLSLYQVTHNVDPHFGTAAVAIGEDVAAILGIAPPRVELPA